MANYSLDQTGGIDIVTTFRFELHIAVDAANAALGLKEDVTAYIQDCDLPVAPGAPITWHLPGGMKNYQAGKRTINPVKMSFVVNSQAGQGSILTLLEKWSHATYDLNRGTNIGKANYCTNGISIRVKGEDDSIKYNFRLLRAQPTTVSYGTLNSEANSLLEVTAEFVYDNYEVTDGNGIILRARV